jgi:hypothetical protein
MDNNSGRIEKIAAQPHYALMRSLNMAARAGDPFCHPTACLT